MNCPDVADQLALLLYNELDDDAAREVRAHLESCAACGGQWSELQRTKRLLDEWTPVEVGGDVRALLEEAPKAVATLPRGGAVRGVRGIRGWRSMITGLAAGLVLMVTLFFVGVNVRTTDGGMVLTFGRAAAPVMEETTIIPAALREFDPQAFETRIQQATFERIDQSNFELAEDFTRFLRQWDELQARQRTELTELLARAVRQDVQRLERNIALVAQGAANDNFNTMRALDDFAQAVARGEWRPVRE